VANELFFAEKTEGIVLSKILYDLSYTKRKNGNSAAKKMIIPKLTQL
jgi:hypothetical protein